MTREPSAETDERAVRPAPSGDTGGGRTGLRGVAAVQRAAVDRALVDPGASGDALVLVGALEAATDTARPTGAETEAAAVPDSPLTAPLASLAAVAGLRWLDAGEGSSVALAAGRPDSRRRLLARGAAVAIVRFGVDPADAASMAALPVERVEDAVGEVTER